MALTQETKTTIGVTAACVLAFLGGASWIDGSIGKVEDGLKDTGHKLDLIDYRLKALEGSSNNQWLQSEMKAWARDLSERNPTVSVPSVD